MRRTVTSIVVVVVAHATLPPLGVAATADQATDYAVAYDVFVAGGALNDALRVAKQALARNPGDRDWQRRLARVADWTAHPDLAYRQWKNLFARGARDPEVTQAVERLAPYANDYITLITLYRERDRIEPLSDDMWRRMAEYYERAAAPLAGARRFEEDYRGGRNPLLGELSARLYFNAGADADAERLYRKLLARHGSRPDWLMALGRLRLRQDDFRGAFALLWDNRARIAVDDYDYWSLLGDLAWTLQEDTAALKAYRHALSSPRAGKLEMDRLTTLLMAHDPHEAAALTDRLYHKTGAVAWAELALDIYHGAGDYDAARGLLNSLGDADLKKIKNKLHFFLIRSHLRQVEGDLDGATNDLRTALSMAPDDVETRIRALWLFGATNRREELQALLRRIGARVVTDNRYWAACAAAYLTLGDPPRATQFYRLQLKISPDDPLVLLAYADLLEQAHQDGLALHLRRRAWRVLREQNPPAIANSETSAAYNRLALHQASGSATEHELRRHAAELRRDGRGADYLDELLLSSALEHEAYEAARGWIVRRYNGTGQSVPAWARLQLALIDNDRPTLQRLITERGNELTAGARYDIASRLGNEQVALQSAFDGMVRAPDDDNLHDRYVESFASTAQWAQVGIARQQYENYERRRAEAAVGLRLSDALRLELSYGAAYQSNRDHQRLFNVPERDTRFTSELAWRGGAWNASVSGHAQEELARFNGWRVQISRAPWRRLYVIASASVHERADESEALQLGGLEDRLGATAAYTLDRVWSVSLHPSIARYHTQHGTYLGSGRRLDWEIDYRPYRSYPDWNVRFAASHGRYTADGTSDAASLALFNTAAAASHDRAALFMPRDIDYYAVCGGVGQSLVDRSLIRGWRPYADLCATPNNGGGYTAQVGYVGSLDGADRLSLTFTTGRGGVRPEDKQNIFLAIGYRHTV